MYSYSINSIPVLHPCNPFARVHSYVLVPPAYSNTTRSYSTFSHSVTYRVSSIHLDRFLVIVLCPARRHPSLLVTGIQRVRISLHKATFRSWYLVSFLSTLSILPLTKLSTRVRNLELRLTAIVPRSGVVGAFSTPHGS